MAVTRYHNIDGSSKSIVELIPPFGGANTLKSIMINTLTTSGTPEVELFIQRPTDTGTDKFSIISGVKVPVDCSLVLDNSMFTITNSFGLYIKLDTGTTADVLLNLV